MKQILYTGLLIVLLASCNRHEEKECTTSFATIGVQVVDSMDKPVKLSSFYTQVVSTKEKLNIQSDSFTVSIQGYPVVTDSQIGKISESGTAVVFVGYVDTTIVVNEKYTVTQDGCHIGLASGKTKVVIKH